MASTFLRSKFQERPVQAELCISNPRKGTRIRILSKKDKIILVSFKKSYMIFISFCTSDGKIVVQHGRLVDGIGHHVPHDVLCHHSPTI